MQNQLPQLKEEKYFIERFFFVPQIFEIIFPMGLRKNHYYLKLCSLWTRKTRG